MILSIEIANDRVSLAEGTVKANQVEIFRQGRATLDPGVVDGTIRNLSELGSVLFGLMERAKASARLAVITMNTNIFITKELVLPFTGAKELEMMVRHEMDQYINNSREYVVEYRVKETRPKRNSTVHVIASSVLKQSADDCMSLMKKLKLRPLAFDYNVNEIDKIAGGSLINGESLAGRAVLLAEVDADRVTCHLFDGGNWVFTRSHAPLGGELKSMLKSELSPEDREYFSRLDFSEEALQEDPLRYNAVNRYAEALAQECQKMIQFQFSRNSSAKISCVYLYGPMSQAKGLSRLLEALLNVSTEKITSLDRLKVHDGDLTECLNMAGAMLRIKGGA